MQQLKQWFEIIANHSGNWEYWIAPEGVCLYASPASEQITGYPPKTFESDADLLQKIAHPDDRHKIIDHHHNLTANGSIEAIEFRIITRSGDVRWLSHVCHPLFDKNGRDIGRRGINRDITTRKTVEAQLHNLVQIVEQSPAIVIMTNINGEIEYVNPKFTQVTGYTAEEVIGQNPRLLKSGEMSPEAYEELWQKITAGEEWHGEFHNKKKNGDLFWVSASIVPLWSAGGEITQFVGIQQDISLRKKTEAALNASVRQLGILSRKLVRAQEEERQRISAELHNEASQALIALKISLELIQARVPPQLKSLNQRLANVVALTETTMEQIRLLAQNLRPPAIDALGLDAALESFCHDFARHTHLKIDYFGVSVPPLPDVISISLYRFLQEACANIAKHAQATSATVALTLDSDTINLVVEDDGHGFDVNTIFAPASISTGKGIGLPGLRDRFKLLGGSFVVESQPKQGTRLVASVPVEQPL